MIRRFLFQLPQFSSRLRIFRANEAIDHVVSISPGATELLECPVGRIRGPLPRSDLI